MVGMQGRQASLSLAGGQPLPLLHRGMEAVPSLLPYRHTILWKLVSPRSLGMGCVLRILHSPGGKDPWYQLSSSLPFSLFGTCREKQQLRRNRFSWRVSNQGKNI